MQHISSAPPGKLDLGISQTEGNVCIQAAPPIQNTKLASKQHNPFPYWTRVLAQSLRKANIVLALSHYLSVSHVLTKTCDYPAVYVCSMQDFFY